jgi:small conductance mechanosensitive channel
VRELSLFWTELSTADNIRIIVPNGSVWGQPLRNFSHYPIRGVEVHFYLPAGVDVERALKTMRGLLEAESRIVNSPTPSLALDRSGADDNLELVVTAWTATENMKAVRTDLIKSVNSLGGSLAEPLPKAA